MTALQQILYNWFMVLHETVSVFEKDDYERLHGLLEPAKQELAAYQAMRYRLARILLAKWDGRYFMDVEMKEAGKLFSSVAECERIVEAYERKAA